MPVQNDGALAGDAGEPNARSGQEPNARSGSNGDGGRDSREVLAKALADATLALGRAGEPVKANRLAAAGYVAVRRELPKAARRLNAVMHDICKQEARINQLEPTNNDQERGQDG